MGSVFRETPGRENGRHIEGEKTVACPLEAAKRSLSSLSSTDHQTDRVAQPPQSLAFQRWRRSAREPCVVTSDLPPATSQPRKLRNGTVSSRGHLKGLSCLKRKCHEQCAP